MAIRNYRIMQERELSPQSQLNSILSAVRNDGSYHVLGEDFSRIRYTKGSQTPAGIPVTTLYDCDYGVALRIESPRERRRTLKLIAFGADGQGRDPETIREAIKKFKKRFRLNVRLKNGEQNG